MTGFIHLPCEPYFADDVFLGQLSPVNSQAVPADGRSWFGAECFTRLGRPSEPDVDSIPDEQLLWDLLGDWDL